MRHIEIDLGDSGLRYQPGDALGVWYQNDPQLVKELVELLWLKGDEPVTVEGKTLPLSEALQWHFELTVNTATIVENYATLTRSESLLPLVGDKAQLQQYAAATPIVDMVRFSPAQLDAEALIGLLRPLTPRLYSIASSQAEVESEVHVTVGVVRYEIEGRARAGGASSFLADRVEEDGEVRVFIEHNDNFRLPANPETPVIMIGPGTGIAPFRAFMQQRAADGAQRQELVVLRQPALHRRFPLSGGVAELCEGRSADPYRSGLVSRSTTKNLCAGQTARAGGPSCGAGSMTAPTFMSAATPIVWRRTWKTPYWK